MGEVEMKTASPGCFSPEALGLVYNNRYSVESGGLGKLSKPAEAEGRQNRINSKLYIVQNFF